MQDSRPIPLPRRYDIGLAVVAGASWLVLLAFVITQLAPSMRLQSDLRFAVILWLVIAGGVSAISWLARPQLAHVAFIFEVARHLELDVTPVAPVYPYQLVARRAIWGACGSIATASFVLAAAIDVGVGTGLLNLHGQNLDSVAEVVLALGCVTSITRIVGPNLAEIDEVYRVAIAHAEREQGVVSRLPAPTPIRTARR